jgi:tetratricopeptide (TPR) repeat protein
MGDDKEAVESFTLATMQDTPLAESFVKLALIQAKSVPDKAIETLLRADRVIPNSPAVLFLLGYVYSSLDRFTDAIAVYDRVPTALKGSDQETPPASFYLYYGSACERAGLFEKAESVFESCLTHYPDDDTVLNYLAYMWADKGINLEKAEQYVSKALQLKPRTGAYVDTLGWIYFKQKKYRNALDKIREANELIKEDPVVTEHLGDTFNALDDKETAISNWKHSLLLDPENKTVVEKLQAQGVDVEPLLKNARKADRSRGKDRK